MAKVELIAKRAGGYPRRVRVGERFKATRSDARVLIAVGAATAALPAPPPPKPAATQPLTVPKRREYLRRDLTAEE